MRISGKIDIFIDKKGNPVGVLKEWDSKTKKVKFKKCFDIYNKSGVELISGHSYNAYIEGYLNLKQVQTKSMIFITEFLSIEKLEIQNDYCVDKSYQDDNIVVPDETQVNSSVDPDELPF